MQPIEEPLATGPCNLLYDQENANAPARIAWTVRLFGNWVGGRVWLYRDRLVFEMNRMNAALQHETAARVLAGTEVVGVGEGRALLGLGATVDLATKDGLWRYRCGRRVREKIAETASGWAAANRG
jgi:hypothetical protein